MGVRLVQQLTASVMLQPRAPVLDAAVCARAVALLRHKGTSAQAQVGVRSIASVRTLCEQHTRAMVQLCTGRCRCRCRCCKYTGGAAAQLARAPPRRPGSSGSLSAVPSLWILYPNREQQRIGCIRR